MIRLEVLTSQAFVMGTKTNGSIVRRRMKELLDFIVITKNLIVHLWTASLDYMFVEIIASLSNASKQSSA